jgi:hypothetical protein
MFTTEVVNEEQVLSRPRLKADWERLQTARRAMAEGGKKGAYKHLTSTLQAPYKVAGEVSKEVSKQREGKEETPLHSFGEPNGQEIPKMEEIPETIESEETDVQAEAQLKDLALANFRGATPDKLSADHKTQAKALLAEHGREGLKRLYDAWVLSIGPRVPRRPLAEFLWNVGKLDAIAAHPTPSADRETVQKVVDDIAEMSNNGCVIGNSQYPVLGQVIESYSPAEVLAAFKEFWDAADEFQQKRARFDFVDGAATRCSTFRRRKTHTEEQAQLLQTLSAQERAKADAELDRVRLEEQEEGAEL